MQIKEWRARLRFAGFVGVVVALIRDNVEIEDGLTGIRYVRGSYLKRREDFRSELLPLITEAVWRREVVYPVEFPADIQSYDFIGRESGEYLLTW